MLSKSVFKHFFKLQKIFTFSLKKIKSRQGYLLLKNKKWK